MVWYKDLYVDKNIIQKKDKIKWKIRHNAGLINIFVITMSRSQTGLLEIISTIELMQKSYPKEELFIVGIAKGYETACQLACNIVMEIFEKTGNFQIKEFLLERQYREKEQANLCL